MLQLLKEELAWTVLIFLVICDNLNCSLFFILLFLITDYDYVPVSRFLVLDLFFNNVQVLLWTPVCCTTHFFSSVCSSPAIKPPSIGKRLHVQLRWNWGCLRLLWRSSIEFSWKWFAMKFVMELAKLVGTFVDSCIWKASLDYVLGM